MLQGACNRSIALTLTIALVFTSLATVPFSYADEEADSLEAQVKSSADAYNSAVARQEELASEITQLDSRIDDLEAKIPQQQKRSDESARALYKYEYDSSSVLMMLLESSSVTDMLAVLDSYTWVLEYNAAEIRASNAMQNELQESRQTLESDKAGADEAASEAYSSLQAAQNAREQAAQRAAQAQAEEQRAQEATIAASGGSEEEKAAATQSAAQANTTASSSNVGWSSDKTAFVNEWAPRIDAYLSGSPTAGTGTYYASAAWDNGVDPRWAPAISYVESSLGAVCFRSHNAWGYGGSGYSSWEEGINAVVSSLGGSLYGGYLTRSAAATYCPTNPDGWYSECAAQMAQI